MDIQTGINDVKLVVVDLQRNYPHEVSDMNVLYYNHGLEIFGMLLSDNLPMDKLRPIQSDMQLIETRLGHALPKNQQLYEYVMTPMVVRPLVKYFWSQMEILSPGVNKKLSFTTKTGLSRLLFPLYRRVILKRCPIGVPVLYAPDVDHVFNSLILLHDKRYFIERWDKDEFRFVNGQDIIPQLWLESCDKKVPEIELPRVQTVDDLQFKKRLLLHAKLKHGSMTSMHYFDAILDQLPDDKHVSV